LSNPKQIPTPAHKILSSFHQFSFKSIFGNSATFFPLLIVTRNGKIEIKSHDVLSIKNIHGSNTTEMTLFLSTLVLPINISKSNKLVLLVSSVLRAVEKISAKKGINRIISQLGLLPEGALHQLAEHHWLMTSGSGY